MTDLVQRRVGQARYPSAADQLGPDLAADIVFADGDAGSRKAFCDKSEERSGSDRPNVQLLHEDFRLAAVAQRCPAMDDASDQDRFWHF